MLFAFILTYVFFIFFILLLIFWYLVNSVEKREKIND